MALPFFERLSRLDSPQHYLADKSLRDAVNVSLGQSVEPTTLLYRISDRSQVNLIARVYEEDLGKVQVGQVANVRTLSYPTRVFPGQIILIGPSLDPQSRTVEVWIRLANTDGVLKPNLFARASVVLKHDAAALTVPTAAIIALLVNPANPITEMLSKDAQAAARTIAPGAGAWPFSLARPQASARPRPPGS